MQIKHNNILRLPLLNKLLLHFIAVVFISFEFVRPNLFGPYISTYPSLMVLFYWTIYRDRTLYYLFSFVILLFTDSLNNYSVGLSSCSFFVTIFIIDMLLRRHDWQQQHYRRFKTISIKENFKFFLLFITIFITIKLFLLSILSELNLYNFLLILLYSLCTAMVYPFLSIFFDFIHKSLFYSRKTL